MTEEQKGLDYGKVALAAIIILILGAIGYYYFGFSFPLPSNGTGTVVTLKDLCRLIIDNDFEYVNLVDGGRCMPMPEILSEQPYDCLCYNVNDLTIA